MEKLFLFAVLAAVALAGGSLKMYKQSYLLTEEEVDEINANAGTWTANYTFVKGLTKEQARSMIGTYFTPLEYPEADWGALLQNFKAPASFDARTRWPKCVNYIRNQGNCGSSWAFGVSEVISDRYCIKGKQVVLSPQYLVSCSTSNFGCDGGYLDLPWVFLEKTGIPTESCVRYKSGVDGIDRPCPRTCDNGHRRKLYKAKSTKSFTTRESIQLEVMINGPIEVAFYVYEDFFAYKGGIYKQTSNEFVGGHGVKLVGWGQEDGVNYWICANSWGTDWGENGYFRVAWGEVGIESMGIAGVPVL